jgi:flagellar motor protein MotB
MFAPGGASLNPSMAPLVVKVAAELAKAPGKVTVSGYTDNVPIRSFDFASNRIWSEQRAEQIMRILKAAGVSASRNEAAGRADADRLPLTARLNAARRTGGSKSPLAVVDCNGAHVCRRRSHRSW